MAVASWGSTLKVAGSTGIVITNEACSLVVAGTYQITNTARRILDPATAIVVKDNGVTVASTFYSLDLLFGKVTFSGYSPTGAITITGAYLTVTAVAEVRSFSIEMKADLADNTTFDSGGARSKLPTLRDFMCSFEYLSTPVTDLDAGTAGTQTLQSWREAGTAKLVEIKLGSVYWRGWGTFETSETFKPGVGDLVAFDASLSGDSQGGSTSCSIGT